MAYPTIEFNETALSASDNSDLENLDELEGLIQLAPDKAISLEVPDEKTLRELENDGLGRYFKRIGFSSLLSREQEFWLGIDVQAGKRLVQLTAENSGATDDMILQNLIERIKISWKLLLDSRVEDLGLEYDWAWLVSRIVSHKVEGSWSRPDDLYFWTMQVIESGNLGKVIASQAIGFYLDLMFMPVEILYRIPWHLNQYGELFPENFTCIRSDERWQWDLDQVIQRTSVAKEELVLSNLRLVISVAKKYRGRGLELEDLIQYGNLGLMRSIEKFDPCSGFRFSTYSYWWIMQAITRSIADFSRLVRLPVHLHDKVTSIAKTQEYLFQKLRRNPSIDEVIEEHGSVTKKDVMLAISMIKEPLSLDETAGDDEDSVLGDFVADTFVVENRITNKLLSEEIEKILDQLPPRERKLLELRYGLDGDRPHTLEEVGHMMGVTRERVRQIEKQALERLQSYKEFRRGQFRDFLEG
jgi:RNA polymerase sigma factor (sigma-70 family)